MKATETEEQLVKQILDAITDYKESAIAAFAEMNAELDKMNAKLDKRNAAFADVRESTPIGTAVPSVGESTTKGEQMEHEIGGRLERLEDGDYVEGKVPSGTAVMMPISTRDATPETGIQGKVPSGTTVMMSISTPDATPETGIQGTVPSSTAVMRPNATSDATPETGIEDTVCGGKTAWGASGTPCEFTASANGWNDSTKDCHAATGSDEAAEAPRNVPEEKSASQKRTGFTTPSQIAFGAEQRLPCDLTLGRIPDEPSSSEQCLPGRLEGFHRFDKARIRIGTRRKKNRRAKGTAWTSKKDGRVTLKDLKRRNGLSTRLNACWEGLCSVMRKMYDDVLSVLRTSPGKPEDVLLVHSYGNND